MRLQCTIQDGTIWIGTDSKQVELTPLIWQAPVER